MKPEHRCIYRLCVTKIKRLLCRPLIGELGLDEFAVETRDIRQADVLGALGGTRTGVGAVAEA